MNPLEALKERLKQKPKVQPNQGVKVILALPTEEKAITIEEKPRPLIVAEKDDGTRAKDILEKIKAKKLSAVIRKIPEEKQEIVETKAPVIEEQKVKKPKKMPKDLIILEEDANIPVVEDLPEGGPRIEELVPQPVAEIEVEEVMEIMQKPKQRVTKKVKKDVIPLGTDAMIQIGDTPLQKRLPPLQVFDVNVSSYYMNNREIFVNFINGLFEPYKEDLLDETKGISCEDIGKDTGEVSLLTHQKIVKDYMNLYSPYRGLLLYHGLGSGKTCTSIAIAEGMKSSRKVIVMTPASLRRNYIEEIKKCGDLLYRKNQFWEWISTDDNMSLVEPLASALGLPRKYITRNHGAWLTNIAKPSNYNELTGNDKKVLNDQLDEMIRNKYTFYNYNGLTRKRFQELTNNFETNIFDNAVVIIDEAHNFISRIVNKINKISKFSEKKRGPEALLPQSLALVLYEFLLRAENSRVVLLTGTPIINYPNEIGILFNILRGYIKTWNFTLDAKEIKLSKESLSEIFSKEKILDYIDYVPSSKTLSITRNPYGFENKITSSGYKGVTNEKKEKRNEAGEIERDAKGSIIYEDRGTMSDSEFIKRIVKILKKKDINAIVKGTNFIVNTALPDTLDEFIDTFIDKNTGAITNTDKFKRRIIGLTSYFRSAQEELLPTYDKNFDKHIVKIPMSDYQFKVYENYRHAERDTEKPSKKSGAVDKDGIFKEPSSTYRIFSRLACNFVMPQPPGRPNPANYRVIEAENKKKKLFAWMKDKYFKNKDEYDPDIQQKLDIFMPLIEPIVFTNTFFYDFFVKRPLERYLTLYFNEDYREPIEVFFRKYSAASLKEFNSTEEKLQQIIKETNATKEATKEEAKEEAKEDMAIVLMPKKSEQQAKKERERETKKEEKEREKDAKKEEKEQEKAAKKEEREKEKEREKKERENVKQREKEAKKKEKEKEQEKAAKKREQAKTAIIIPFRDSEESKPRTAQLNQFVEYMNTYLSGQKYEIFVIEQTEDGRKFNRGQLLNIGFNMAVEEGYNNFIFHDVDLLPSDELKQYYLSIPRDKAIHIAAVWDRYNKNPNYFGGIVAFNKEMFQQLNGYPNNFWGWGGEDDELQLRTSEIGLPIEKVKVGSIVDLEGLDLQEKLDYLRDKDLKFMKKREALAEHPTTWQSNGLNSIRDVSVVKTSSCGTNCKLVDVELMDTDVEEGLKGGGKGPKIEEPISILKENLAEKFVDEQEEDSVQLEDYKDEDAILREADELEGDEILETMGSVEYKEAIKQALKYLQLRGQEFLTTEGLKIYGPKFLAMLENIEDEEHQGLHLVYSQFRSMEGIGIFSLVLEANGFAKFKIKRSSSDGWELNMSEEDIGKPCYALYTGTEDSEEREIIRNIYNGTWNYIPNNIATQLRARSSNNNLGEIIKVLMITSAGSEGINLRNTRYVHIMEPYWHPVRLEQVVGRARRICSHQSLPKALQSVEVYIYIMTFTKEQLDSEFALELKLKDLSKMAPFLPQSSDEKLLEISTIKEQLTSQLLIAVKEASIDCATHAKSNTKEGLVCLSFGQPSVNDFSYNPTISQDQNDTIADINRTTIDWEARPFTYKPTDKRYMLRMDTKQVYDYDSVIQAKQTPGIRPILLGKLVKLSSGEYEIVKEKV